MAKHKMRDRRRLRERGIDITKATYHLWLGDKDKSRGIGLNTVRSGYLRTKAIEPEPVVDHRTKASGDEK